MLDEETRNQYSHLIQLFGSMTRAIYKRRPSCSEILSRKQQWSINEKALLKLRNDDIITLINVERSKCPFLHSYLTFKMENLKQQDEKVSSPQKSKAYSPCSLL